MLEKKLLPYEFLARWKDGKLTGAHVGFVTQVLENGILLSSTVGDVMSVNIGQGHGYPLADILPQLHIDALAAIDALKSEVAMKQAELDAVKAAPVQPV